MTLTYYQILPKLKVSVKVIICLADLQLQLSGRCGAKSQLVDKLQRNCEGGMIQNS